MKKLLTLLSFVFFATLTFAQTPDYLQQKDFQAEKKKINEGINASRKQVTEIKKEMAKTAQSIDSIRFSLKMNAVQIVSNTDSLTGTNRKVNALKEQLDGQKVLSRSLLILLFIIIFILFMVVFIVMFVVKKKVETNYLSMLELDKKYHDQLESEVKRLNNDLQNSLDAIHALSTDLNQKMSAGFISLEAKTRLLETQWREEIAGIDIKFTPFTLQLNKLRDEQALTAKTIEEKLHTMKHESDLINQGFTVRTANLEEELKLLKRNK